MCCDTARRVGGQALPRSNDFRGIAPARSFVPIEKESMMRTTLTALALAAALLAACGYGQPGSPAPTVYGTQQPPSQGTVAPMPTY